MSKREEIIDGSQAAAAQRGLVYTENLGWIDLGHAQGTDIQKLWAKMNAGELQSTPYYEISYSQSMMDGKRRLRTGKFITWLIRKGRSYTERQSIALAMMMDLARKFETFQESFPNHLVTDSGFSGEDLVSDLLGFYRVMGCISPFRLLQPVSKEEALKRWDYYGALGLWKNETFRPLLFPDPDIFPGASPYLGYLPGFMTTITPYNNWGSGDVLIAADDGNFIQFGKGASQR